MVFKLETEPVVGVLRKVGGHPLSIRYAVSERGPALRFTDITDPGHPAYAEVPFEYRPGGFYPAEEKQDFRVAGHRYSFWADSSGRLHMAPSSVFSSETLPETENVAVLSEVFQAWADDVMRRSREIKTTGVPGVDGRRLRAYFETLDGGALRVSLILSELYRDGRERYQDKPMDVAVIKGRAGRITQSRILYSGREAYRFLYNAAARTAMAQEAR